MQPIKMLSKRVAEKIIKHLFLLGVFTSIYLVKIVSACCAENDLSANEIWKQLIQHENKRVELFIRLAGLAHDGNSEAQYFMGQCLDFGLGTNRSTTDAVSWYKRSADQFCNEAMWQLVFHYGEGIGVQKDDAQRRHWLRKLADADDLIALGAMEYDAQWIDENAIEAIALHKRILQIAEKKALKDDYQALLVLVRRYETGDDVEKSEERAKHYLIRSQQAMFRAAMSGNPQANYDAGEFYEFHSPGFKQLATATIWYERAFALGYYKAANRIAFLHKNHIICDKSEELSKTWSKISDKFKYSTK